MITAIMTSFLTLILTQIQENPWCQNFGWKFWLLGIAFHKGGLDLFEASQPWNRI